MSRPLVISYSGIMEQAKPLLEREAEVVYCDQFNEVPEETLRRVEGLLTRSTQKVDKSWIEKMPSLKIVSNVAVGYNNIDVNELSKKGIIATNTPGVLNETTADLVLAIILATARRIPELDRFVKEGKWTKGIGPDQFGVDVHGKTLGIIGLGQIGEAIARRCVHGFRMKVIYHNRSRNDQVEQELGATFYESLNDLLEEADYVLPMVPLTPETKGLIDKEAFSRMKETAIFINASRGAVVDEKALIEALQSKQIRGAGLDVFEQEPVDPNNPLLKMDHVVTVPHIGSATRETRNKMWTLGVEQLLKGLQGKRPLHVINENVLQ